MRDTHTRFSWITVSLHWIVALTIIGLLAIGVFMVETEAYYLFNWHESFGFLIFFIVLCRVVWRFKNGLPTPVGQYSNIEQCLAKVAHWVLIVGTVLMPISGFLMSALGGRGLAVFGLEIVALNADPLNPNEVIAYNETIANLGHSVHHWLGYILIATVALHIFGALKHHVIDKDGTLKRMLGKQI